MKWRSMWGSYSVWASCDNPLNTAVQTHTFKTFKAACNDGINLLDITSGHSRHLSVSLSGVFFVSDAGSNRHRQLWTSYENQNQVY